MAAGVGVGLVLAREEARVSLAEVVTSLETDTRLVFSAGRLGVDPDGTLRLGGVTAQSSDGTLLQDLDARMQLDMPRLVAELLDGLTEVHDPYPELYDAAIRTLASLAADGDPRIPILHFELRLLAEIGHLPDFEACAVCHRPIVVGEQARYWVSQGSLLCSDCGRPEFQHTEMHAGTVAHCFAL